VKRIYFVQNREIWPAVVNTVMKPRRPHETGGRGRGGGFLNIFATQLCSLELKLYNLWSSNILGRLNWTGQITGPVFYFAVCLEERWGVK
jgi:hypothetical protein